MEKVTTYDPPEILNDMDEDTIHARMLAVIPSNIDKTEGGFAWDFTRPAAIEKADAMIILNEIIQLFFPEWSSGEFLDKLARPVGLTRKAATAAETTLHITGVAGTIIPEGFLFSTAATAISANIEFQALEAVTLDVDGTADVPVQCTTTGIIGNVSADSIVLMSSPMSGITSVTNPEAATGGTDIESDDDFSARITERERNSDSSYVGCDADYKRWAQEVDGVGTAIVLPEWQGLGTGTVKLIIMDANGEPATTSLITAVYNHIISPDDRQSRLAPIGAILTVVTASTFPITIEATVSIDDDANIDDITAAYKAGLASCFEDSVKEGVLRYTRVGAALSKTTGVVDYQALTINGDIDNIDVGIDQYPVAATINLTVG